MTDRIPNPNPLIILLVAALFFSGYNIGKLTSYADIIAARPGGFYAPNAAIDPNFVRVFQAPAVQAAGPIDHSNPNNPGAISAQEMARRAAPTMTPMQWLNFEQHTLRLGHHVSRLRMTWEINRGGASPNLTRSQAARDGISDRQLKTALVRWHKFFAPR